LITGSTYDAHDDDLKWVLDLRKLVEDLWRARPDMYFSGVIELKTRQPLT
jgi:hypothetical protein